jgi:hypothetical protein
MLFSTANSVLAYTMLRTFWGLEDCFDHILYASIYTTTYSAGTLGLQRSYLDKGTEKNRTEERKKNA